jgi:HAD superfamily hydrolase (TIGR01509 family)
MIAAIIFDLDGTVLDNVGLWEEAFRMVADRHDVEINQDFLQANGYMHEPGLSIAENWKRYVRDIEEEEKLSRETWNEYHKMISDDPALIKVRVGVDEVIEKAKEKGLLVALATGSTWTVVEPELTALELYLAFDVTTTGEEVAMLKPDPEIYLLTAQKLGLEPSECLVIEDAIVGVRAAIEAGCQVVGLISEYAPRELLEAAGATKEVERLEEVTSLLY